MVDSILLNAARLVETQRALNEQTTTAELASMKSKGQDLGASAFKMFPAAITVTGAWCISFVKADIGTEKVACIDNRGTKAHGGSATHTAASTVKCAAGVCTGT